MQYTSHARFYQFLFWSGFALLQLLPFIGSYRYTTESLSSAITGKYAAEWQKEYQPITNKDFATPFAAVAALESVQEQFNQQLLTTSGLGDEVLNELAAQTYPYTADNQQLSELLPVALTNAYGSYGGWLNGRQYSGQAAFKADLQLVAGGINNDLISKQGFADYRATELTFSATKAAVQGPVKDYLPLVVLLTFGLCTIGGLGWALSKNNPLQKDAFARTYFSGFKNRQLPGLLLGTWLIAFYIVLYFKPAWLVSWVLLVDPLAKLLSGGQASHWFLYGVLYTLAILVMGVRMLIKHSKVPYQQLRTASVMFFQLIFAFPTTRNSGAPAHALPRREKQLAARLHFLLP